MGKGTWLKNKNGYFNIKLTTVDRSENTQVVHKIKEYWEQLGVKVNPEIIPVSQIQSSVIKPKNFEALFYGITLGVDPDPYVFWHSSQAEKGLNLSGYESDDADKLLEDARHIVEENKRKELYFKFQDMIAQDVPAIFIYSTKYSYVQSKDIKGFDQRVIYYPSDRFSKIGEWYLKTGKKIVW
jgi:peptide/nickel transport system substrate-binding protein